MRLRSHEIVTFQRPTPHSIFTVEAENLNLWVERNGRGIEHPGLAPAAQVGVASCVWRRAEATSKLSDSRHELGEPGWSEASAQVSCHGKLLSYLVGTVSTQRQSWVSLPLGSKHWAMYFQCILFYFSFFGFFETGSQVV